MFCAEVKLLQLTKEIIMSKKRSNRYAKMDSTKGRSMLTPETFKGDVNAQAWVDSRILATLSDWLDRGGNHTRFMSEVIQKSLKVFQEYLVNIGEVNLVDDTGTARQMLETKYRVNLNPGERGRKNEMHNRMLCERLGKDSRGLGNGSEKVNLSINNRVDDSEKSDAMKAMEDWEESERKRKIEEAKEQSRQAIASFGTDENGIVQVPTHGRGDYTEADKLRDERLKRKEEQAKTLKQCESIKEESEKKVRESAKIKANDDMIAPMSQDELDRREEERKARDKAERDAFNSVDVSDLSPVELDD